MTCGWSRRARLLMCSGVLWAFCLMYPIYAHACKCARTSPEEYVRGGSIIFTGEVVEISKGKGLRGLLQRLLRAMGSRWPQVLTAEFVVHERWKGPLGNKVSVRYFPGESSCGMDLEVGDKGIYRATGTRKNGYWTGLCTALRAAPGYVGPAQAALAKYRSRLAELREAVSQHPRDGRKWVKLTDHMLQFHDLDIAQETIDRWIETLGPSWQAYFARGRFASIRGVQTYRARQLVIPELELSLKEFDKSLSLMTDLPSTHPDRMSVEAWREVSRSRLDSWTQSAEGRAN